MSKTINQLFAEQVRLTPDAIAIESLAGSTTYAHLDRRSNAIAVRLRDAGVQPHGIVAVGLDRSVDAIASFLAVLKIGAVYCPLDLADPPARHAWMVKDLCPAALITTRSIAVHMGGDTALRLYTDEMDDTAGDFKFCFEVDPSDPACVMYTSGSTGTPKGALVTHRGIVRLFANSDPVPLGPQLRMLSHSPMHFDATTYEIWAPLLNGGTCVLFGGGSIPSLHEFRDHIFAHRVNTLFLGPALFNLIVDEDVHLLDGVDILIVGGDALSPKHIRAAQAQLPRVRLVNGYGPTETTTFAAMYIIPRPFSSEALSVPIGKPIAGTTTYVLDSQLQQVPAGIEGELFIGSDGVSLGYLNRPDLTAERFLPDPFADTPGAKMYRTGDLCRFLPDGCIDFVGRVDGQVKIRGRRIEPGEIEANLLQHPGVSQCVVTIVASDGEKHIIAYYVPDEKNPPNERDLRKYLDERLPAYLAPRDLIAISQIPRKSNGKINRDALPAARRIAVTDTGHTAASEIPQSPLEKLLTTLWRDVLAEPDAGTDTCFFASGGTSLEAVRLCCLIERQTGQFIPVSDLLTHSTPRKLAIRLDQSNQAESRPTLVPLNDEGAPITLFCLSGQVLSPLSLQPIAQRLNQVAATIGVSFLDKFIGLEAYPDTEETARDCLKLIRARQPTGPYHIMGYSYGGTVAFEMAQQLHAAGESVKNLILLDADIVTPILRFLFDVRRFLLRRRKPPIVPNHDRVQWSDVVPSSAESAPYTRQVIARVNDMLQRVNEKYRAVSYPGDALFIQSSQKLTLLHRAVHPAMGGWPRVIGGRLEIRQVTGDHMTMLVEPHAVAVSDIVRAYLSSRA